MMTEQGLSLRDALRLQLKPEKLLEMPAAEINCSVSNGKWLESVIKKLLNPDLIASLKPGQTFRATLRKYQQKGVDWLLLLHSLCFGACLADDMGLGKTVQVLAFLHILRSGLKKSTPPPQASLLVVPASLISNWVDEIKRFAPDLKYLAAHPGANSGFGAAPIDLQPLNAFDLVITTYVLVQKYSRLQAHLWNYIILDEAQAIKNPGTKQTKVVKKLSCRGRSYARNGAVLDLQIRPGQVKALVQDSRLKPYTVIIQIGEIKKNIWQKMRAACAGKLDSLRELLDGKFPEALGEIFTAQGRGLFPSPQEIEFNCSCPDWAYMCKHVAATLYGIGSRLDANPGLFFELRKVNMDDLIQQAVRDQNRRLLKKAGGIRLPSRIWPVCSVWIWKNLWILILQQPLKKRLLQKKLPENQSNERSPLLPKKYPGKLMLPP